MMTADTDTYEKIAAHYAGELRALAKDLDRLRRRLGKVRRVDRETLELAVDMLGTACQGMVDKARSLEDLPAIAGLWIDQEDEG